MFKQHRRERALRDQRALFIAAAGMGGGDAFKKVMGWIDGELKVTEEGGHRPPLQEESEMPLTAEDLKRQLTED